MSSISGMGLVLCWSGNSAAQFEPVSDFRSIQIKEMGEMRMKSKWGLLALCMGMAVCTHAKTVLPDSCGEDSVKFEVKGEKDQPPPAPPASGKAQIVFINTGRHYTARYGVDGAWSGANEDNSYFAVAVDPGEHHLCMSYQTGFGWTERGREAATKVAALTVEAGKVYYIESTMGVIGGGAGTTVPGTMTAGGGMTPAQHVGGSAGMPIFGFSQLDDDTGKYHVKAYKLATWKTK